MRGLSVAIVAVLGVLLAAVYLLVLQPGAEYVPIGWLLLGIGVIGGVGALAVRGRR